MSLKIIIPQNTHEQANRNKKNGRVCILHFAVPEFTSSRKRPRAKSPIPTLIEAPSAILLAASSYPLERPPRVRIELAATQSATGAPRRISQ